MARTNFNMLVLLALCTMSMCSCKRESTSEQLAQRKVPARTEVPKITESPGPLTQPGPSTPTSQSSTPLLQRTATNSVESSADRSQVTGKERAVTANSDSASNGVAETSTGKGPKFAHQGALARQQKAKVAARDGNIKMAYTDSLSAWESLREFPDDDACRKLSAELLSELEVYGEHLSSRPTGLPPNSVEKPIRFE